jgi:hypothetical protein
MGVGAEHDEAMREGAGRTATVGDGPGRNATARDGAGRTAAVGAGARRAPRLAWPWRLLGLASVVLFAAVSLPPAFSRAGERLSAAVQHRGESATETRRRCRGAAFIASADQARSELGPKEPYYLVEGDEPKHGGALMVRFELAPRPAAFLGPFSRFVARLAASSDPAGLRRELAATGIRRVVIAFRPGRPPLGWPLDRLLAAAARRADAARRSPRAKP